MAKIVGLQGFITVVSPVQVLPGEKATPIQYVRFEVPGYTNAFAEKKGRDQQWLLQIIGKDKIDLFALDAALEGSKAKVAFYAESFELPAKEPGANPFYVVNNTLAEIEIIP